MAVILTAFKVRQQEVAEQAILAFCAKGEPYLAFAELPDNRTGKRVKISANVMMDQKPARPATLVAARRR